MRHTIKEAVPARGRPERQLEQLKTRLLRQLVAQSGEPGLNKALRRAADDAASVAWFTPFPLLFFPTLLEEKARGARQQERKQRDIQVRSERLLDEAVS